MHQWKFSSRNRKEKKKAGENEHNLRNLWNKIQWTNMCIAGFLEREKRERRRKNFLRNDWKHPNGMKDMSTNIQEGQQILSKINLKRSIQRHIIIKLPQD